MELRECVQDRLNRFALTLAGIPETAKQNRVDLGRPERLVHPAGEPCPSDFLHAGTEPCDRKLRPDRTDPLYRFVLRYIPCENSLDQHLVNFVLPEFQGQPESFPILRWFLKHLGQPLLKILGVAILSLRERMQSSHSLVCQILPLPVVLDAIQQDDVEFPCPGGTFLCAVFRAHVDPSTAIPSGALNAGTTRTREKRPLYK